MSTEPSHENSEVPRQQRHTLALRISNWLLVGQCGISASYMAAIALNGAGYRSQWPAGLCYPREAWDLARCVRLLEGVPEVRSAAFPVLRELNAEWRVLIEHWDELTAVWRGGDLNATNARLRELRKSAENPPSSDFGAASLKPCESASSQPGELTAQLL